MAKLIEFPTDGRRADAAASTTTPRRRVLCTGVIRRATDPRPVVRMAARVGDAVFRLTTLPPDGPRAA